MSRAPHLCAPATENPSRKWKHSNTPPKARTSPPRIIGEDHFAATDRVRGTVGTKVRLSAGHEAVFILDRAIFQKIAAELKTVCLTAAMSLQSFSMPYPADVARSPNANYQQRKAWHPMDDGTQEIVAPFPLRKGETVEVHSPGYPPYCGHVEESMPSLNVVWIRELRTGERKMLSVAEHCIHRV
ncbi:hypothetical protein [Kocuria oceani]|uniref:Uncharacterized protein n=1 Tax=Kocuria oceani TaxID=988827 RepID=A0ABV9TPK3_9MICC|nr:hypothetical protein [Kocuria oceani]